MFSLVEFQVTIAELLIIIMRSLGIGLVQFQIRMIALLKIISKHLDRNQHSKLDEEVPMEIDHL
ncbi:ORF6 [Severe acute respiratory syndrome-related coronavirus]|uniref:ORF6 protein n=1 Tax=Severe acute respiratory syndrome coronavirus TaxID=694009 RepID=A0A3Q8B233_SARS|nr:ORF6 [Severe acute respiratory syndrome-related coronavirus]